ncbi:MAG: Crp/Fnr family transcriptional regulator [Bacteroidota bacterium]
MKAQDFPPLFIELFTNTMGLNEEEFELFCSHFRELNIRKKDFYLKEGSISNAKAYVKKGCSRSFVIDENGKEHILSFGFEDWWLADFESYHSGNPGKENFQALEDMELLVISKQDFAKMQIEIPKLQRWAEVKHRKKNIAMINQLAEIKSSTPEQRYLKLLDKHPEIFQRVPLQYIASYLDIEPQSLSRLRKRITCK